MVRLTVVPLGLGVVAGWALAAGVAAVAASLLFGSGGFGAASYALGTVVHG